nr:uncharacterized protein LOC120972648 [Aegilops tauschii subsp. strangulata]
MAAKQKKKSAAAQTEAPRQEEPRIVFPASMTGSKPKVSSAASELKKTRAAEAEARKRKHKDTSDSALSKKKLNTKSSKKDHATAPEPLIVEPISVVLPASTNQERRLVIHEPASIEAHASADVPAADPNTAKDIGQEDNVDDDVVLPQLQSQSVSPPALTSSELISIGCPLTPIAQDDSWAECQQQDTPVHDETPRTPPPQVTTPVLDDDDNYMVQTTPSPKASPAFHRLRKGPRLQVTMSSIPEGEVQQSSVARQVFPEATPAANASESEAKVAEDIPVENPEADTNNVIQANDSVMAEDNVEPKANENAEVTLMPIISDGTVPPQGLTPWNRHSIVKLLRCLRPWINGIEAISSHHDRRCPHELDVDGRHQSSPSQSELHRAESYARLEPRLSESHETTESPPSPPNLVAACRR